MSADAAEAAASATMVLRAILASLRYCRACGTELPYLGGRGRPRRWCDAHHPRPARLCPRAPRGAGLAALDSGGGHSPTERDKARAGARGP